MLTIFWFKVNSEGEYKVKYRKGLKTLNPKQMIQRLPTALAQAKAGNVLENALNDIGQIIYSRYQANKFARRVYNNIVIWI